MTTAEYIQHFTDAELWGQTALGLPPSNFQFQNGRKLISRNSIERLMRQYCKHPEFSESKLSFSAMSCLISSLVMQPEMPSILGVQGIVTVGYASVEGSLMFYFDQAKIQEWSANPGSVSKNGLQLHAWITLDTGEIVDFTLAAAIATHWKEDQPDFEEMTRFYLLNPFMGTADDLSVKRKVEYHPLGVGEPFVKRIGINF